MTNGLLFSMASNLIGGGVNTHIFGFCPTFYFEINRIIATMCWLQKHDSRLLSTYYTEVKGFLLGRHQSYRATRKPFSGK